MMNKIPLWIKAGLIISLLPPLLMFTVLWVAPSSQYGDAEHTARAMRGFTNIWFAGSLAMDHSGTLYDVAAYRSSMRAIFGASFPEHIWGYPPSMLLVAAPFAMLPIFTAFILWTVMGILALISAAFCGLKSSTNLPKGVIMAAMISPAVAENLLSGQTGALAGSLLLGGLILCSSKPRMAGIMFGILAVKPQMGFLLPMHLFASRKWLVLLWSAASLTLMFVLSCLFFGIDSWIRFISGTGKSMSNLMSLPWTGSPAQVNFTSPFMAFKALGFTSSIAWTIQAFITLGCIIACWKMTQSVMKKTNSYPSDGSELRFVSIAGVICLDLLSVPYSHNYDMPALAFAIAIIIRNGLLRNNLSLGEKTFLSVAWFWPGIMVILPVFAPQLAFTCPIIGALSLLSTAFLAFQRVKNEIIGLQEQLIIVHNENNIVVKGIRQLPLPEKRSL